MGKVFSQPKSCASKAQLASVVVKALVLLGGSQLIWLRPQALATDEVVPAWLVVPKALGNARKVYAHACRSLSPLCVPPGPPHPRPPAPRPSQTRRARGYRPHPLQVHLADPLAPAPQGAASGGRQGTILRPTAGSNIFEEWLRDAARLAFLYSKGGSNC
jgi:hypothetical protein